MAKKIILFLTLIPIFCSSQFRIYEGYFKTKEISNKYFDVSGYETYLVTEVISHNDEELHFTSNNTRIIEFDSSIVLSDMFPEIRISSIQKLSLTVMLEKVDTFSVVVSYTDFENYLDSLGRDEIMYLSINNITIENGVTYAVKVGLQSAKHMSVIHTHGYFYNTKKVEDSTRINMLLYGDSVYIKKDGNYYSIEGRTKRRRLFDVRHYPDTALTQYTAFEFVFDTTSDFCECMVVDTLHNYGTLDYQILDSFKLDEDVAEIEGAKLKKARVWISFKSQVDTMHYRGYFPISEIKKYINDNYNDIIYLSFMTLVFERGEESLKVIIDKAYYNPKYKKYITELQFRAMDPREYSRKSQECCEKELIYR